MDREVLNSPLSFLTIRAIAVQVRRGGIILKLQAWVWLDSTMSILHGYR